MGTAVEFWEGMSNSIQCFTWHVLYFPYWDQRCPLLRAHAHLLELEVACIFQKASETTLTDVNKSEWGTIIMGAHFKECVVADVYYSSEECVVHRLSWNL